MVDLANWTKITSLTDLEKAPVKHEATGWGKSVLLYGAPASSRLKLGKTELGIPIAFTKQGAPDSFAKMSYKVDGIIGNAPFWDRIVVLDLTANVQVSFSGVSVSKLTLKPQFAFCRFSLAVAKPVRITTDPFISPSHPRLVLPLCSR